jgi:hypothetical protein
MTIRQLTPLTQGDQTVIFIVVFMGISVLGAFVYFAHTRPIAPVEKQQYRTLRYN